MADYEQLIKKLRTEALDSRKAVLSIYDLCIDAADKIENLISENAALRRQIDNLTSAQAMMVKEFDKKLEELHDTKSELDKYREAEQDGRLVVLPFIPHSTMLNLSDPENLEVMEDVRLYVAWKSPSGIVFHSPYSIFLQNIEKGYIKPDSEDAEAALKGGEG